MNCLLKSVEVIVIVLAGLFCDDSTFQYLLDDWFAIPWGELVVHLTTENAARSATKIVGDKRAFIGGKSAAVLTAELYE
jgi:hypothetical protein